MTLGQMLREARQKKGWSVGQAEVLLGVNNLSRIENDIYDNPTLKTLAIFAKAYGLSPAKMLATAKIETALLTGPRL